MLTSDTLLQKEPQEKEVVLKREAELEKDVVASATVVAGISTEESKKLEKRIEELESQSSEKEKVILTLEKERKDLDEAVHKMKSQSGDNNIVSVKLFMTFAICCCFYSRATEIKIEMTGQFLFA